MTNPTVLSKMPLNRNFLSPIPYALVVQKLPNVDFFVQKVNLPGITSQAATQPTMFTDIPRPGAKLRWNPLFVTFKVDEEMANWQEIWNWMIAINLAVDTTGYATLNTNPIFSGNNVTSEMTLIVHDNERQPNFNIYYHDCFPITLTDIQFDGTKEDVEYVTVSTTFLYSTYDVEKVI